MCRVYKDHLGNEFKTLIAMCDFWNVSTRTYRNRINKGVALKHALTSSYCGKACEDHLGNSFSSEEEMCRHYNISSKTFRSRIRNGCSLEDALTRKLSN